MKRKIKVLQIGAENFGYGGRSVIAQGLALNMNSSLVQNDFLALKDKEFNKYIDEINKQGRVLFVPFQHYKGKLSQEFFKDISIFKIMRKYRYDIVHIHADNAYEAMKSLVIAKFAGINNIYVHAHSVPNYSRIKNAVISICRNLLPLFNPVKISCTKEAGNYMFGNGKDVIILKDGINVNKFRFNKKKRQRLKNKWSLNDKLVIGTVARLSKTKNLSFLVKLFSNLKNFIDLKDIVLIVVGDGDQKETLLKLCSKLNIESKVIFMGNRDDVFDLLQIFDVFVLPSYYEGFGMSVLEAQAAGIPTLVSTGVSSATQVVEKLSYQLDLSDGIDKWTKCLIQILKSDYRRKDTSQKIKDAGYDILDSSKKLQKLYENSVGY